MTAIYQVWDELSASLIGEYASREEANEVADVDPQFFVAEREGWQTGLATAPEESAEP